MRMILSNSARLELDGKLTLFFFSGAHAGGDAIH